MGAITEYIRELQSFEEYSFSTKELYNKKLAPESSMKKELARLVADNQIINLRKGFYIIIPPRYQHFGKIPIELYANKLFKSLDKSYYLAFYTAAAFYGASHQRVQQDYVVTSPPSLRDIEKGNIKIRFFNCHNWPAKNIIKKQSDAGNFLLSSPALTFADLLANQQYLGGLNRMLANLEELTAALEITDIEDFLTWYNNKSVLQRMGFLLDLWMPGRKIADMIFKRLIQNSFYPVLLNPVKGQNAGSTSNRWKVDVNLELQSDL